MNILKKKKIKGLNVTIPYKESIINYLDRLSEDAKIIGAVNTVRFLEDGTSEGYNTDAHGFEAALLKKWNNHSKKALILGTGGASKAIEYVLKKMNIGIIITDHNVKEALSIVEFGYIIYNGEIIKSGKPQDITSDKFVKKIYLGENYR